jgi:hypothetical protein
VIDQDQARKFWTNWVRREIGGSEMIQDAAVSAAVNELLLGHDNQAAADAARNTARQLSGGAQAASATLPTATPAATRSAEAPTPAAAGPVPAGDTRILAPLNSARPMFQRPWPYVAGAAGLAVAAIIIVVATRSVHNIGCLVSQPTLAHRATTLHNAFVDVYNRDFKVIDACTSVDCEKAPKLEIAASLKTYNDGLNAVCWPDKYKAHANSLMQANAAMADAFTTWATATTPAEDESLQTDAKAKDNKQGVADDILSIDLGVPLPTGTPS